MKERICLLEPAVSPQESWITSKDAKAAIAQYSSLRRWGAEVRVHHASQSPSLYRFDDECLIAPNVYGLSASRSPVIRIRRTGGDDLFRTYLDGWENV